MDKIKLYSYNRSDNERVISFIPPSVYEYEQKTTRLIAKNGYFLTKDNQHFSSIDIPNDQINEWQELKKEDYKFLFKDEFPDTKDESFSK